MTTRQTVLGAYRLLLNFYPPGFRKRFAPEMLELAQAAAPSEWPLIFSDTGVAIARCWIEGSPSTAALAESNAYISLGGSPVRSFGFGFVLSAMVLVGLTYAAYRWPPPCPRTRPLLTQVVSPPEGRSHTAEIRQTVPSRAVQ